MKIDVTGETREGLIRLLNEFPQGKLVIEKNRIVWKFDMSEEDDNKNNHNPRNNPNGTLTNPVPVKHDPIKNMQDYLFETFKVN